MKINVFWGSETGNAESLADDAVKALTAAGLEAEAVSLEDTSVDKLKELSHALIITSTWGDGEPPSNAINLHEELSETSESLENLSFSVLGIGQSFYDNFCQAAKDFDEYLAKAGAKRISELELCDDDYDDKFPVWIEKIISIVK